MVDGAGERVAERNDATMKVTVDEKQGKLTIELDLNANPQPSSTGKMLLAASTAGFTDAGATYKGRPLRVNVTAGVRS